MSQFRQAFCGACKTYSVHEQELPFSEFICVHKHEVKSVTEWDEVLSRFSIWTMSLDMGQKLDVARALNVALDMEALKGELERDKERRAS